MRKLFAVAVVSALLCAQQAFGAGAKIDPALLLLKRPGAALAAARKSKIVKSIAGFTEEYVSILVRFDGDAAALIDAGGRIRSTFGDVATMDAPLSAVESIAALPGVVHLSAARNMKLLLDASVPATGADALRSGAAQEWSGATGRNVVIGIVDSGIDLAHADFRTAAGTTRVLALWDQTDESDFPPSGYAYGSECSQAAIDNGACSQKDTDGHGTHIAGIAAGNGTATGRGQAASTYVGLAPDADLVVVRTDMTSAGILDGVAYIQAKAAALGRPSVINLSLGSHYDPHDGTSEYAQALNNASGPGKIIVNAAGNEADADVHAGGTITQGSTKTISFTLPAGVELEVLDLWYPGADRLEVMVGKGTCTTPYVGPDDAEHDFDTACGGLAIISSSANPNNGDREIQVALLGRSNGASHPLSSGTWSLTLKGHSVSEGKFDVWAAAQAATFTTADPKSTICDGGTATNVITVGSFNTKKSWTAVDGHTYTLTANAGDTTLGQISSWSSLGPRRSCSMTENCPDVQKPEIAAPGMAIFSAYSSDMTPAPEDAYRAADGVHMLGIGTSMAAPHVTGAVALLLQLEPSLTPGDVKTLLANNAATDLYTGSSLPDDAWGYGKLDIASAFSAAPNTPPGAPQGLAASVSGTTVSFSWSANEEPDLDGYRLYRSAVSGNGYAQVNAALIPRGETTFTDASLAAASSYYYVLKAVDTGGEESAASNEAAVTTGTAPAANGSGTSGSDAKCFIATAAYGSSLDRHVVALRTFRDRVLMRSGAGRAMIAAYYRISPPISGVVASSPCLRCAVRTALTPAVFALERPRAAGLLFACLLAAALPIRRRLAAWKNGGTGAPGALRRRE